MIRHLQAAQATSDKKRISESLRFSKCEQSWEKRDNSV